MVLFDRESYKNSPHSYKSYYTTLLLHLCGVESNTKPHLILPDSYLFYLYDLFLTNLILM